MEKLSNANRRAVMSNQKVGQTDQCIILQKFKMNQIEKLLLLIIFFLSIQIPYFEVY